MPKLEVDSPNRPARGQHGRFYPELAIGPHAPIVTVLTEGANAGKRAKFLSVRVSAAPRLSVLGLPIGRRPVRGANDVSVTIDFLRPDNHDPFLPRTPGGLWVAGDLQGEPVIADDTPVGLSFPPGESRLLLVAVKIEGEERCYALDAALGEGLFAAELAIERREALVEIRAAGTGCTAERSFRLENADLRLESFDLVRGLAPLLGFWRSARGIHREITAWRSD